MAIERKAAVLVGMLLVCGCALGGPGAATGPAGVRSVRRVMETAVPATGAAVVQAAPLDAEGGGLFLVIWTERK